MQLPGKKLQELMLPAYSPCIHFGACREAKFVPDSGHVPRGFLGATGALEEVELVMVFSRPGSPKHDERYQHTNSSEQFLKQSSGFVYDCFNSCRSPFHKNARWFINQRYPGMSFDEQLRHVWLTNARLCSVLTKVRPSQDNTCTNQFLRKQISLLPNAIVVAFGDVAESYLKPLNIDYIKAYSLSPPRRKL
ncbi:hypothetical protein [Pseudovibrio sp. POLY-S9]|uniref:hypothetical protein n=1 Tax=Pseudovibrio sp. POLY-S9 TaxID=1576596 RepID=UPI000B1767D4|nr:hypothetical protein [Pseudovibrio sp. POLY-S9]